MFWQSSAWVLERAYGSYDENIQKTDGLIGQAAEAENGVACFSHADRGGLRDAGRFHDLSGHEYRVGGKCDRESCVSADHLPDVPYGQQQRSDDYRYGRIDPYICY